MDNANSNMSNNGEMKKYEMYGYTDRYIHKKNRDL